MPNDTFDLMDILSNTSEDKLQGFISKKIDGRIVELRERQKRLHEEMAAINHELQSLEQYANGGRDAPSPQEVLIKLLKGR
jgi:hypothetical protein